MREDKFRPTLDRTVSSGTTWAVFIRRSQTLLFCTSDMTLKLTTKFPSTYIEHTNYVFFLHRQSRQTDQVCK